MVRVLPSRTFCISSSDTPDIVIRRLQAETDTKYLGRRTPPKTPFYFEGSIKTSSFVIHRTRDWFTRKTTPRIAGRIQPSEDGSLIEIRTSLDILEVFGLLIVSLWSFYAFYIMISEFVTTGRGLWGVIFPISILMAAYFFSYSKFYKAVHRDVLVLENIITGKYRA
jgi:hypothetical protein